MSNEGGKRNREHLESNAGRGVVLSVWALLAGSSIYKIFGILAVMAAAEAALFYRCLETEGNYTLGAAVERSHISVVFLAALGAVCLILTRTEGRMDTESSGTMLRLRLSGGSLFGIKTLYNMACLALVFILQIWLCIWLVGIYGRENPEVYASPQRLFLAFYRIDFLHCLLPMAETGKWVRNLLLVTALGMEAAGGRMTAAGGRMITGTVWAEKRNYIFVLLLYILTASWFVSSLGGNWIDLICGGVYGVVIAVDIWQVWKAEKERIRLQTD